MCQERDTQLLWNRKYKKGSTDPNFEEKIEYRSVLPDCLDFINEKTCLMFLGVKLGVEVDWSMKSIQSWQVKEYSTVGTVQKVYKGKLNFANRKVMRNSKSLFLPASLKKKEREWVA
jgi:hypothetical protein